MTKSELTIIKLALTEVVRARVEKVKSLPPAPFPTSDSFNKAMVDLINERKARQLRVLQIRKAVAIAIIAALVLSFAACCIIYREEIKGFFVEMHAGYAQLNSNNASNVDDIFCKYSPSYTPVGYTLDKVTSGNNNIQHYWKNGDKSISLVQIKTEMSSGRIDTYDESYFEKTLNGTTLHCTTRNHCTTVIWKDSASIFTLVCTDDISWDEIENMILSLELVE